jgi:hypothetical protein
MDGLMDGWMMMRTGCLAMDGHTGNRCITGVYLLFVNAAIGF